MEIDRRAFIATLGGSAVIEAMSSEAKAEALEHYMSDLLDESLGFTPHDHIEQVVANQPKNARALAVPGMPMGSPGMEVPGRKDAYNVMLIDKAGKATVYAKR